MSSSVYFIILLFISLLATMSLASDRLEMVLEICRHGARAPVSQEFNVTKTYWPEGTGMLTRVGERQHYLLGKELRKRYVQ